MFTTVSDILRLVSRDHQAENGVSSHESRDDEIIIIATVFLIISYIAVGLRLWARSISKAGVKLDDCLNIFALFLSTIFTVITIKSVEYGTGKPRASVSDEDFSSWFKIAYVSRIIYPLPITAVKLSVLLLYRRLFPVDSFRLTLKINGAIIIAWMLAVILGSIFSCIPIQNAWLAGTPHARCLDMKIFQLALGSINILTDIVLVALPLPFVWRLNVPAAQKVQLVALLSTGGLVCAVSCVRVYYVGKMSKINLDPTWNHSNLTIWTVVEICMTIVSACLPTLRPLFVNNNWRGSEHGSETAIFEPYERPPTQIQVARSWEVTTTQKNSVNAETASGHSMA
ncbi:hypothetical protein BJ875DRAFT_12886 [Amylocarpus encephaloides]|uniref:Rhodopsin domain-containing protein n=1 Tax=Amylocarpus encephaloides TaxID=45428 RepID=A0A9P7YJ19_9HELO|nr:hypothetical protein BJ875DRAFT_12886 [Amylocarpus encephaloides]